MGVPIMRTIVFLGLYICMCIYIEMGVPLLNVG